MSTANPLFMFYPVTSETKSDVSEPHHPFKEVQFVCGCTQDVQYGHFKATKEDEDGGKRQVDGPMVDVVVNRMTLMELSITWKDAKLEEFFVGTKYTVTEKKNRIVFVLNPEDDDPSLENFQVSLSAKYQGETITFVAFIRKE